MTRLAALGLAALLTVGCLGPQLCYERMRSQKTSACQAVAWCYHAPLPCAWGSWAVRESASPTPSRPPEPASVAVP